MRKILFLRLTAVLFGLLYSPLTFPQSANTASANQCATMLERVRTGDNVNAEGTCNQEIERQMVQAISRGQWDTKCQYTVPSLGWKAYEDTENYTYTLLPDAMHYFSQHDFQFVSTQGYSLSQVEFVFLQGLEGLTSQLQQGFDKRMRDRISEIRKLYPSTGVILPDAGVLLLTDESENLKESIKHLDKSRAGNFKIRRAIVFEDGKQYVNETISIFRGTTGELTSNITLLDYVDPYPTWEKASEGSPKTIRLSCTAKNTMSTETFGGLCAIMMEKQSLAPVFSESKSCDENGREAED